MEKWKDVLVSVSSQEGDDDPPMRMLLPGRLSYQGTHCLLQYKERIDEEGTEETEVKMHLSPKQVMMMRSGNYGTSMVFSKGKRFESQYHTPYGDFPFSVYTTRLEAELSEEQGLAKMDYQMDMGNNSLTRRTMMVGYMLQNASS